MKVAEPFWMLALEMYEFVEVEFVNVALEEVRLVKAAVIALINVE